MTHPKARALIGVVTTGFFVVSGVSFLLSERYWIGALLTGLGLLRGVVAVQQLRAASAASSVDAQAVRDRMKAP